jgi:hypothetical protein
MGTPMVNEHEQKLTGLCAALVDTKALKALAAKYVEKGGNHYLDLQEHPRVQVTLDKWGHVHIYAILETVQVSNTRFGCDRIALISNLSPTLKPITVANRILESLSRVRDQVETERLKVKFGEEIAQLVSDLAKQSAAKLEVGSYIKDGSIGKHIDFQVTSSGVNLNLKGLNAELARDVINFVRDYVTKKGVGPT